jgi:hypothetical protein
MAALVASQRASTIEVRISASPLWFSIVRSIAGQLAERAKFDEDARTDLRVAADEACWVIAELNPVDTEMRCAFTLRPEQIDLEVSAPVSRRANAVPHDTLGWQLLRTVTDELTVQHWPSAGRSPSEFRLTLTKRAA